MRKDGNFVENFILLFTDCLSAVCALLLAVILRHGIESRLLRNDSYVIVCVCVILFCFAYNIFFSDSSNFIRRGYYVEAQNIFKRSFVLLIVIGCMLFFVKRAEDFSRLVFVYFLVLDGLLTYVLRITAKNLLRRYYVAGDRTKVMIITVSEGADRLVSELTADMDYTCEAAYVVLMDRGIDDATGCAAADNSVCREICGIPVVAGRDDVIEVSKGLAVDEIYISLPSGYAEDIKNIIVNFDAMGVVSHLEMAGMSFGVKSAGVHEFAGKTVMDYGSETMDAAHAFAKRLMDIAGALAGLLITAMLYPFVALAIKLDSPGPVVFSQVRIGKNGRRFRIYKFRSMYLDAEKRKKELEEKNQVKGLMFKMDDDPRITKVGRFIRKTSIDELPQFYNVLKGDMSLVGTRPPTEDEFEKYTPYYRRRISMTPGLTGLWQVSGRSSVQDFDDVVKYDLQYIDYWSLSLDIKILFRTVYVVLFGKGAK